MITLGLLDLRLGAGEPPCVGDATIPQCLKLSLSNLHLVGGIGFLVPYLRDLLSRFGDGRFVRVDPVDHALADRVASLLARSLDTTKSF